MVAYILAVTKERRLLSVLIPGVLTIAWLTCAYMGLNTYITIAVGRHVQAVNQLQCSAFPATPFPLNLWYVKAYKAGSTTLSATFNNICTHYGMVWLKRSVVNSIMHKSWVNSTMLNASSPAMLSAYVEHLQRTVDNYFLALTSHLPYSESAAASLPQPLWLFFTSVRHPLPRVYSHFVQDLCINAAKSLGWTPLAENHPWDPNNCDHNSTLWTLASKADTIEARWKYAKEAEVTSNVMFEYLRGSTGTVQEVVSKYNFIFVVERMNESLVLFMLEFGLTYADIAYLPFKQRVGKYKSVNDMPSSLNGFLLAKNGLDLELWQLANQRLDHTKWMLERRCGKRQVAAVLRMFNQLQSHISVACTKYQLWYATHNFSSTSFHDPGNPNVASQSGQGYRCVQHVVRTYQS